MKKYNTIKYSVVRSAPLIGLKYASCWAHSFNLTELEKHIIKESIRLYRGGDLAMLMNTTGSETDGLWKTIIQEFQRLGLKITINVNLEVVNFLVITQANL